MKRSSLVIAGVALVAIVLWKLALDDDSPPEETAAATPSVAPEPVAPSAPEPAAKAPEPATAPTQEPPPSTAAGPRPASAPPEQAAADQQPAEPQQVPVPAPSGPIASLKHAFESEPRDSAAHAPESLIENEFKKGDIDPGLLKSAQCRQSVCKVAVNWSPKRALSFMSAFTRLSSEFDADIAFDPHAGGEGIETQVDVYLPRRQEGAKEAKPAE